MLRATAASAPRGRESWDWVSLRQVRLPLTSVRALANGSFQALRRIFPATRLGDQIGICFDASLMGGGAVLSCDRAAADGPDSYILMRWTRADRVDFGATKGDIVYRPHREAFALLIALSTWQPLLQGNCGGLSSYGNATGVLKFVISQRAGNRSINMIVTKMQLILASTIFNLETMNAWSKRNVLLDELSQVCNCGRALHSLSCCSRTEPVSRAWQILSTDV